MFNNFPHCGGFVLQPASGGTADGFGEGAGAGEEQGATDGSGTSEEGDPFLGGSPGHAGGGAKGRFRGQTSRSIHQHWLLRGVPLNSHCGSTKTA